MQNALVVPGPVRPGPPVSPLELAQLVSVVASQPARWHPTVRFDPARRWFAQLELTTDLEVWLLSWLPGQGTGFHDHYISSVGLCCARGVVREDLMVYGEGHGEAQLGSGDSRRGGPGYIHRVRHALGEPAVTIHVYSPRLDWVGQYRLDDSTGVVRREVRPGRNELTDQLVAEGALHRVLERF